MEDTNRKHRTHDKMEDTNRKHGTHDKMEAALKRDKKKIWQENVEVVLRSKGVGWEMCREVCTAPRK